MKGSEAKWANPQNFNVETTWMLFSMNYNLYYDRNIIMLLSAIVSCDNFYTFKIINFIQALLC